MNTPIQFYILKDKKIVISNSLLEWGEFFENKKSRRVAWKMFIDGTTVSTVFLGLDHGWHDDLPVLFESMVFPWPPGISSYFCKDYNPEKMMERYHTWAEAEKGHLSLVEEYRIKDPLKILRCIFWPLPKIIAVYAFLYTRHYIKRAKKKFITFVNRRKEVFSRVQTRKP